MSNNIRRICLTPTRNEGWIIERFLAAARQWATDIVVIDQKSDDGTLQRLQATPGLNLIINESTVYDEAYRQRTLIDRARQLPGKRIFVALDADEALSANCLSSAEWARLSEAEPGTVLRFRWVNILPGFTQAWIPSDLIPCGFVDDGAIHVGDRIHSRRIPWPKGAPVIDLKEVVVLHFQYVANDRVVSKHRWYQAWEKLNHPDRSILDIFRQYHHMHGSWEKNEIQSVAPEWFEGYRRAGIDFESLAAEPITWWDRELLQMLLKHGPDYFRKVAIWDKDWNATARTLGLNGSMDLSDPRSTGEKIAHQVLRATQRHRANWGVRAFEKFLRKAGW